jgi:hypothetical protein
MTQADLSARVDWSYGKPSSLGAVNWARRSGSVLRREPWQPRGEVTGLERYEDLGPDLYALEKVENILVEHADAAV